MHRVRLYPTAAQDRRLEYMLHATRHLYNAALQERRDAYKLRGITVTAKMQYAELTALRAEEPGIATIYRECQDAVLHRLDLAMQAFFRRIKRGETPGFPRYKPAARWSQLEFPHGDRALKMDAQQRRVRVPSVGLVLLRKGRSVPRYGRAFIVRKNDRWYAVFECERDVAPLPASAHVVGVDRGVRVLAATSAGELIANPRHADRLRSRVELHAIALDGATKKDARGRCLNRRDPARVAAVRRLARAKEREANARRDYAHKVALGLVRRFDLIAIEDMRVRNMTRSAKGTIDAPGVNVAAKAGLNRALLDAGFSQLATLIREKAEYAVRTIVSVDARYTSQTCAACLHVAAESRSGTQFVCVGCGHKADADINAARNILARATAQSAPMSELSPGSTRLAQHDAA
jgi:putative transposase